MQIHMEFADDAHRTRHKQKIVGGTKRPHTVARAVKKLFRENRDITMARIGLNVVHDRGVHMTVSVMPWVDDGRDALCVDETERELRVSAQVSRHELKENLAAFDAFDQSIADHKLRCCFYACG